jgi:NitT/TauT family transport system substrate-binding protein
MNALLASKRRARRLAPLLALAFVVAPAIGIPQTADLATVRVGTAGQQGNAGVYYAADEGFFKKNGLQADITTIRHGSGAAVVAAVIGGSLDVGDADLISIAAAREHGLRISIIAPSAFWVSTAPTGGIIVAKSSPVKSAKDLNGKTIGVPSLEGLSRIATNAWLEQNGADLAAVKFVEMPSSSMPAAVARGQIDAAVLTEPTLSLSLADNRIAASPYDALAKEFNETGWFATDDWIAKNPQLVARFATAIRDANRRANANQPAAEAIFMKYSGVSADELKNAVHTRYAEFIDAAHMQPVLDAASKYKAIPQPLAARDLLVASKP